MVDIVLLEEGRKLRLGWGDAVTVLLSHPT